MAQTFQDYPELRSFEVAQGALYSTAFGLMNNRYPDGLTPDAQERYATEIPQILQRTIDSELSRFALRFTLTAIHGEPSEPALLPFWHAIFMKIIVDPDTNGIVVDALNEAGMIDFATGLNNDPMVVEPEGDRLAIFELNWADVMIDFDPTPYND